TSESADGVVKNILTTRPLPIKDAFGEICLRSRPLLLRRRGLAAWYRGVSRSSFQVLLEKCHRSRPRVLQSLLIGGDILKENERVSGLWVNVRLERFAETFHRSDCGLDSAGYSGIVFPIKAKNGRLDTAHYLFSRRRTVKHDRGTQFRHVARKLKAIPAAGTKSDRSRLAISTG